MMSSSLKVKIRTFNLIIEEEKALIKGFDEKTWIKLLNRRVQHYGFEFVYGANNVDKTRKLGDMPDFLNSIILRIEEKLKHFTYNDKNEVEEITEDKMGKVTNVFDRCGSFD